MLPRVPAGDDVAPQTDEVTPAAEPPVAEESMPAEATDEGTADVAAVGAGKKGATTAVRDW